MRKRLKYRTRNSIAYPWGGPLQAYEIGLHHIHKSHAILLLRPVLILCYVDNIFGLLAEEDSVAAYGKCYFVDNF